MIPSIIKLGQHCNFTIERMLYDKFVIPNFQRPLVWTQEQKIKLIESIWLGIPIGTYTINEAYQTPYDMIIIDGQQRINAIKEYISDTFKVYDMFYSELRDSYKKRFINAIFPRYTTQSDDIEYLKKYYNLMNFGGTAHKKSERA
jgi:hypothetical protein